MPRIEQAITTDDMSVRDHMQLMRCTCAPRLDWSTFHDVCDLAWEYGSPNGFSAVERLYRELHDLAVIMITQGDFDDE